MFNILINNLNNSKEGDLEVGEEVAPDFTGELYFVSSDVGSASMLSDTWHQSSSKQSVSDHDDAFIDSDGAFSLSDSPNSVTNDGDDGVVALYVQSHYSLLSSTIKIDSLVKKAKDFGITSLALTDSHNLFGAMEFSMACEKHKVHGIIGCVAKIEGNREILLYCKNKIGYENLSAMLTESYVSAKDSNPYIRWDILTKKAEGIIAIVVPSMIAASLMDLEHQCIHRLGEKIEWYFGIEPDASYAADLSVISKKMRKSIVAISRACFMYEHEEIAHDAMLCIRDKRYMSESDRNRSSSNLKLKTNDEMRKAFAKLPFALKNSLTVAGKCNFLLSPAKPQLPRFASGKISQENLLTEEATSGLKKRLQHYTDVDKDSYFARLEYELEMINGMGFAGYFLIVSDFIKFAKRSDIPVGPGRGSGSGSIVAWALEITEIDPISFDLYFERFLNPDRVSMPDFDIDFSPKGREIVINYVRKKYGSSNVAGIITFGSLSSRAALKDVGRVLHIPYTKTDALSKEIEVVFGKVNTLQETYDKNSSFAAEINADEEMLQVFQIAQSLEGCHRHVSAHAAGIIIRSQPIYTLCPLYKDQYSNLMLTQFSMKAAEAIGLVKFDFLGLTALDVIQDTVKILKDKNIVIDINKIPLDDSKTFEFMRKGNIKGIFQFETRGMTALIKDIKADCIGDLIAIVALYRPGPMDNIPLFIRSKEGAEKIQYKYPQIDKILSSTYGVMIYQEQIIKIAQEVAGFTMSEADLLRRAMGKKIQEEMASYRERFIEGAIRHNGGTQEDAEEIFDQVARFANYGFNKAHAAAYAIIGYSQAYLKAHYPLEFIQVSMTLEQSNVDKVTELINDAKQIGIKILPPSINKPTTIFTAEDGHIRYCVSAIKNIGIPFAEAVNDEIKKNGFFRSFEDFTNRVTLNKRQLQYLIMSGALDCFGLNRGRMYTHQTGSVGLFSFEDISDDDNEWSEDEYLQYQQEALGAFIDKHVSEKYPLYKLRFVPLSNIDHEGLACVMTHKLSKKMDRNKARYGILSVSDISGFFEIIIPNEDIIIDVQNYIDKLIVIKVRNRKGRMIADEISTMDTYLKNIKRIRIKINKEEELLQLKKDLSDLDKDENGTKIILYTDEKIQIDSINKNSVHLLVMRMHDYLWAYD